MRMLLVEDDVDIVALFRPVLEEGGFQVDSVGDSLGAVMAVIAHPDYDLVLMDLLLSRSSGYVATLAIRAMGYEGPVVAVTGIPQSVDRKILDACRFAGTLIKPIAGFPSSLIKELDKHIQRPTAAGASEYDNRSG